MDNVEIATDADLERGKTAALAELGVTGQELLAQARRGWFDSNQHRLVWMGVKPLIKPLIKPLDAGPAS